MYRKKAMFYLSLQNVGLMPCKFSSFGLHIFEISNVFRGSDFGPYRFSVTLLRVLA